MDVADRGADIFVAEQLLDFPQTLSHVVEQNGGRAMPQPMGCDLPHPNRSARRPEPKVESPVENGAPEYRQR